MTFECATCRARYRIDESIVPPGGARTRCRRCSSWIEIKRPAEPVVPAPRSLDLVPPSLQEPSPPSDPRPARGSALEGLIERTPPPLARPIERDPEIERFPSAMGPAAQSPTPPVWETAADPAPSAAPALPEAPEAGAAPSPVPGPSGGSNVVPLTMGTRIPEGLSPEERARHEKARRLARVLASDIAIYNRDKKERGIQDGNLVAILGYEIKKSWETYKERVGADFANATPYFRDALNELLAEGKKIF